MRVTGLSLLLLSSALAGACSQGDVRASEGPNPFVSLLVRAPDRVTEELGRIEPSLESGWGSAGTRGWEPRGSETDDGQVHVWSNRTKGALRLPALGPGVRTIEFYGWIGSIGPERVALSLNGEPIDDLELQQEPGWVAIETPAELWRTGLNELAFDAQMEEVLPSERKRRIALRQVRYGERRVVSVPSHDEEALALRLEPGTGVTYRVSDTIGRSLTVGGRALGDGALSFTAARLEPRTGQVEEVVDAAERLTLAAGDAEALFRLPPTETGFLEFTLNWEGVPTSALEVSTLGLSASPDGPQRDRPPIVFISIDTLAARNMSLYGYARETTPELERFAESAVTFERCKANAAWTLPSYASQVTGLYPRAMLERLPDSAPTPPPGQPLSYIVEPDRWTLAERVRSAGYATAAFIDNSYLRAPGFRQGFDLYDDSASRMSSRDPNGGMRRCFPRARAWVDGLQPGTPYFLFVQVLDCHGPYTPSEGWRGHFAGDALARGSEPVRVTEYNKTIFGAMMRSSADTLIEPGGELPEFLDAVEMTRAYDEKVREVDAEVGAFLDALRERPDYDDLIIVLSADHGEAMSDHGQFFNHSTLYESVVHVPLMVRLPGDRLGGTRVSERVQLVDLYPTLAELAGVSVSEGETHGRSLVPRMEGGELPEASWVATGQFLDQRSVERDGWKLVVLEPRAVEYLSGLTYPPIVEEFGETLAAGFGFDEWPPERWYDSGFAKQLGLERPADVRSALEAVNARAPWCELYHLDVDPFEQENVAADHPERVAELLELFAREELRMDEAATRVEASSEGGEELSDEDRLELERLGYLDADD